jgi:hypothetical protein
VDIRFDTGTHSTCAVATSAPSGEVAVVFFGSGEFDAQLFSPSGVAHSDGPSIFGLQELSSDLDVWLHPVNGGWQGIVHEYPPPLALETWDVTGVLTAKLESIVALASAPDGAGGSVVVGVDPAGSGQGHLVWVRADGAVQRDVVLDRPPWRAIVQWSSGHVLVLSSAGTADATARWFGADGTPLTPWFDAHFTLQSSSTTLTPMLRLLLDGRPVVYDGAAWSAAFHDGTTTVDTPPSWLAIRAGKRLAVLPGGRGYAVLGGNFDDVGPAEVELLTPAGETCGMLRLPPGPAPAGGTRPVFGYFVGQDGTLIEGSNLDSPDLGMGIHCAFRWWPRLFGR